MARTRWVLCALALGGVVTAVSAADTGGGGGGGGEGRGRGGRGGGGQEGPQQGPGGGVGEGGEGGPRGVGPVPGALDDQLRPQAQVGAGADHRGADAGADRHPGGQGEA